MSRDIRGKTPLHAAASGIKVDGTIETVDYLLKHGAKEILNQRSTEGDESKNALSSACFYGQHETAKFLLEKGANLESIALKYAVEKNFSYTAKVLMQSSQWRNGLRQTMNGAPIINEIIKRMPEIAIDVLDNCTVKSSQTSEERLRVAFNFEFLESFKENSRSSLTDNKQEANYEEEDFARNAQHYAKKDIANKEKEFEDVMKQRKQYFGPKWGLKAFKKSLHPLSVMVRSENYDLLTHPVVRALLHHKWIPFGLLYDILNVLMFTLFLVFITSLCLSVATPFSQDCPFQGNGSTLGNGSTVENGKCSISMSRQMGVTFTAVMTIIFAAIRFLLRLGKELILMCKLKLKYFTNFYNLLEWVDVPCYILSITFASIVFQYDDCPCPSVGEWQVGIAGVFLSWITFLKYINKVPYISKYILMLWRIVQTFGKVALSIGIPLVLAFSWPLYMALYDPKVSRSPFQNPGIAIASVLSMTTGSFEFDNTFRRDSSGESDLEEELPYLPITYIIWVAFVILMPVLLNNLLVGLAIGDIDSVEEEAKIRNLVLKIELVLEFEELLPSYLRSKWRTGYRVVNPYLRSKKNKWHAHKTPEILDQVFARKRDGANQHTTKKKEQLQELQQRLERMEKLLEGLAKRRRV